MPTYEYRCNACGVVTEFDDCAIDGSCELQNKVNTILKELL